MWSAKLQAKVADPLPFIPSSGPGYEYNVKAVQGLLSPEDIAKNLTPRVADRASLVLRPKSSIAAVQLSVTDSDAKNVIHPRITLRCASEDPACTQLKVDLVQGYSDSLHSDIVPVHDAPMVISRYIAELVDLAAKAASPDARITAMDVPFGRGGHTVSWSAWLALNRADAVFDQPFKQGTKRMRMLPVAARGRTTAPTPTADVFADFPVIVPVGGPAAAAASASASAGAGSAGGSTRRGTTPRLRSRTGRSRSRTKTKRSRSKSRPRLAQRR